MTANEIIKQRFPHERTQVIADNLGLTYSQVANRAFSMGLKKTLEFKKSDASGRKNLIEGGKKFRFVPGHAPHNKGVKMPDEVYNKVKPTMFKKGIKPHNTQPVGTINIRQKDNDLQYQYIKIKDRYWKLLNRYVWEQAHGKIPSKHIIKFKDGNTLNCDINNLECISMKQNIEINTIQRYPDELQQIMKLTAKLNRKINGKKQN